MSLRKLFPIILLLTLVSCEGEILPGQPSGPATDVFEWYDADGDPEDVVMVLSKGERVTSNRGIGQTILFVPDHTEIDSVIVGVKLSEFDNDVQPNMYFISMLDASNEVGWVTIYDAEIDGDLITTTKKGRLTTGGAEDGNYGVLRFVYKMSPATYRMIISVFH